MLGGPPTRSGFPPLSGRVTPPRCGLVLLRRSHPLGLWEGATENATVCQGLLTNLGSRGLRTDRSLLVIVDGAQALDTAVTQTFGRAALVQRCQVHKGRNILEHLPEAQRPWVKAGPHARLHEQPRQDGHASAAGPGAALGH